MRHAPTLVLLLCTSLTGCGQIGDQTRVTNTMPVSSRTANLGVPAEFARLNLP